MWFILLRPRPPPEAAEDVLHFLQEDLLDAGLVEASRKWLPKGRVLQPVLQHPPWIWAKNKGIKRIHPRLTQRGMWPELSSVQKSVLICFFSRELIVGSLPVTTFCSKEIRSPKRQDTTGLTWLAAFFCGLKDKKRLASSRGRRPIYILLPHANTHESILCHLYISILWALSIKWSTETWIKRTRTSTVGNYQGHEPLPVLLVTCIASSKLR